MKKLIGIFLVVVILCGLCACGKTKGESVRIPEPDDIAKAQEQSINELGYTVSGKKIVGYKGENEYVEYIVAEYYETGLKKSETHCFYYNSEYSYDNAVNEKKQSQIETDDSIRLISYTGNFADSGSYDDDLKKITASYTIK